MPGAGRGGAHARRREGRGTCQAQGGAGHSPVQLGVLHQSVGVSVTDEGPTCEADEAFGVVFQLPGHLEGELGGRGQATSAAPSAPIAPPLGLLAEGQPQTNFGADRVASVIGG